MSDWEDYGDDTYSDDEWKDDLGGNLGLYDEFRDKDRSGGVVGCWVTGIDNQPLKTQTPLGRFCLKVDAVSRNINATCRGFTISDEQIQHLLNASQNLKRVEFKNPTAFVLGYLATDRGVRSISKDSLRSTWECYKDIRGINKDTSIKKPDIIRYARLWKE